jgi:hypothetical protein
MKKNENKNDPAINAKDFKKKFVEIRVIGGLKE